MRPEGHRARPCAGATDRAPTQRGRDLQPRARKLVHHCVAGKFVGGNESVTLMNYFACTGRLEGIVGDQIAGRRQSGGNHAYLARIRRGSARSAGVRHCRHRIARIQHLKSPLPQTMRSRSWRQGRSRDCVEAIMCMKAHDASALRPRRRRRSDANSPCWRALPEPTGALTTTQIHGSRTDS
jgi:hypothetical protein